MKLHLAASVVLCLCGLSLSQPRHGRLNHESPVVQYRQQQQREVAVDKFNFIDLELLELAAQNDAGNIVLSPVSVKTALSMLWEGSDGSTADEIGAALRLTGRSRELQENKLHQYQKDLMFVKKTLKKGELVPSSTLELASQVFVSDKLALNPKYQEALAHYRATAQSVNMSDTMQSAAAVNKWVNMATHGLVPSLVEESSLSEETVMVLANAVYFQGKWQTAFDPDSTSSGTCFYPDTGECLKVQMMETMGTFKSKLVHELDATLLEMPYDDGRYSMLILLPERRDGMPQLMRNLLFGNLLQVLSKDDMEESDYVVLLPKFTIDYEADLVPFLQKLHVKDVFTPSANLTRMVKQDMAKLLEPAVSNVFHKAKIVVDERGAVAAGTSGALVVPLMGGPQPKFKADHPFLFFIRDSKTSSFLFAGRVSRPDEAPAVPAAPAAANESVPAAASPSASEPAVPLVSMRVQEMKPAPDAEQANIKFPSNSKQE